jgi:hypothetical protein
MMDAVRRGTADNPGETPAMLIRSLCALAALSCAAAVHPACAQDAASKTSTVPVTVESFVRAESDRYFGIAVKAGGFGQFNHRRELIPLDKIFVVRVNRDTLYSTAVFDLDAGPVTITLPDAGGRFRSLVVIDEDQHVPAAVYDAGVYTFSREKFRTRYVMVALRTLYDPANPEDRRQALALQDATQVSQKEPGRFEVPAWDQAGLKKLRDALLVLGERIPDSRGMFGTQDQVSPVRHLIGAAMAWGGNGEKDALYFNVTPARNDGATIYRLNVKDVPVDAFWSVSVYDAAGFFQPNEYGAYTLNNLTAKKGADGSVAIQLGGCDGRIPNCLPVMPRWNYMVRLYRPRAEILSGDWKFPEAKPEF